MNGTSTSDPTVGAGLRVRGLSKRFTHHLRGGEVQLVLDNVDLDLAPGTVTVLTGPSGSGKSSLLRCIYRTYLPEAGSIDLEVAGRPPLDLAAASDHEILECRATDMAMVTQFLSVVPRVGATDLVAAEGVPRELARQRLLGLGLTPSRLDDPPATFSGGERQIVNVTIALARPRPLLLVDEATASLDPARRERVIDALVSEKGRDATILAVFHDVPRREGFIDALHTFRDHKPEPVEPETAWTH